MKERLNGAIVGVKNLVKGAEVDSLTFVFNKGASDVTINFTTAKNRAWTLAEIVAKINATESGLAQIKNVTSTDRRIKIEKDLAVLIVKKTGTANSLLGLSTAADVTADPIALSEISYAGPEPGEQSWVVTRYV
jgi:hypothetical protein